VVDTSHIAIARLFKVGAEPGTTQTHRRETFCPEEDPQECCIGMKGTGNGEAEWPPYDLIVSKENQF
jgi:hypothetical protein